MDIPIISEMVAMMRRYEYMGRLLKFSDDALDAMARHKHTVEYPLIDDKVLDFLENSIEENQTPEMLRDLEKLRKINKQAEKLKYFQEGDTQEVLEFFFFTLHGDLPEIRQRIRHTRRVLISKAFVIFLLLSAAIVFAVYELFHKFADI